MAVVTLMTLFTTWTLKKLNQFVIDIVTLKI